MRTGVGDKLATAVQYITTFAVETILGFIRRRKLTLVPLFVTTVLRISWFMLGSSSPQMTEASFGTHPQAGRAASGVLCDVRCMFPYWSLNCLFSHPGYLQLRSWFDSTTVISEELTIDGFLIPRFAPILGSGLLSTARTVWRSFSRARVTKQRFLTSTMQLAVFTNCITNSALSL